MCIECGHTPCIKEELDLIEKIRDEIKEMINIDDVIDFLFVGDIEESGWDHIPNQKWVENYHKGDRESEVRLSIAASLAHYKKDPEGSELGKFLKRRNKDGI